MNRAAVSIVAGAATALACGPAPQRTDEVAVVYRAVFQAEAGVNTEVVFPLPGDGTADAVLAGLAVTDGGTAARKDTPEGPGLSVQGRGRVEATFSAQAVKGIADGTGIPEAALTRQVPDAGAGTYYVRVNKGGAAIAQIDFEYTASRNCGAGCGGSRGWTYAGSVGLALQQIDLRFTEAKQ